MCRSRNVHGLDALDLTTLNKSGAHWDLSRKKDRDEARQMVIEANMDHWQPTMYRAFIVAACQVLQDGSG